MSVADDANRGRGNDDRISESAAGPKRREVGPVKYNWVTEARTILTPAIPCSVGHAVELLMLKLTPRAIEIANRGVTKPRLAAARQAIRLLCRGAFMLIDNQLHHGAGGNCTSTGHKLISTLKATGKVQESEAGFKQRSMRAYRPILQYHLKWITIINVGNEKTLVWCGPDSACWSDVVKIHSSRRPYRPK